QANTDGLYYADFVKVAWSADGRTLLAGGRIYDQRGAFSILMWGDAGRGPRRSQPVSRDTFHQIVPCGSGYAGGTHDPLFALLHPDGSTRLAKSTVAVDMRNKLGEAFQVSRDGRQVGFGLQIGDARPAVFDVTRATLREGKAVSGVSAPRVAGLAVAEWLNSQAPRLSGTPFRLYQDEISRSLAIAPDTARFVLGTEFLLRAFDARGQEQWAKQASGIAWGVNITSDGRLVVAAYGDGTIRWHRMSDGQELLALFVHKDDQRWVAWTPSG